MSIARLRCLRFGMYKTINRLHPAFMTDIFKLSDSKKKQNEKKNVPNLNVTRLNQLKCVERSLRVLGSKISNNPPADAKSALNLLY